MTGSPMVKPSYTPTTAPYWEGLAVHELRIVRCRICGASYWPWSACREHDNEPYLANMEWVAASGLGRVFAHNVHLQTMNPAFPAPYVYALIELDEGPLVMGNIEGDWSVSDGRLIRAGDRVKAVFVDVPDSHTVLSFELIGGVRNG